MRNPTDMNRRGHTGEVFRHSKKAILVRLWAYIIHYKWLFFAVLLLTVLSNLFALFGPNYAGKAIGAIGTKPGEADLPLVWHYVLLVAALYVFSAVMTFALRALMVRLSQRIVGRMRSDIFASLSRLPIQFFDQNQAGDIISTISYDVNTINESLANDFVQLLSSAITIVGALIMMLRIAPLLALIFAFTVPLSVLFTTLISKKTRPLFRARSAKLGALNGYVEEMVGGQKTIQAYGREEEIIRIFDRRNESAVDSYTKAEKYGTMTGPSVSFINNLSLAFVSVFGAILYIRGAIGLDGISSFVLYSRKFSGPISELANIYNEFQSAFAAAERVFRLIDEAPEKPDAPGATLLACPSGEVELRHVRFGYTPEKTIIHDLSLCAPKGSLTAIVGPTGAGKTTIINLLMRFYDIAEGDIRIDGTSIYDVTRDSLRSVFTMVLQDTWLFGGTVFENIAYGKPDATMEEVVAAAKAARIHNFITCLPDGYQTVLSEGSMNISKGQKQLLTIARAMLMKTQILILDEATSNVDTQTEVMIQQAMYALMKGKTCFVIAHRLSTIRNADQILVVKDGNVVEKGTHDTLMAAHGVYADLYASQFTTY